MHCESAEQRDRAQVLVAAGAEDVATSKPATVSNVPTDRKARAATPEYKS